MIKTVSKYFLYTVLATVLFSCGKPTPKDIVTDSENMIVYYIQTDVKENYKYEYRITDGENEIGFRFYSNRILQVGDTLRICK